MSAVRVRHRPDFYHRGRAGPLVRGRVPTLHNAPLAGFRVVDLTSVMMGPWATQILANYGADVIKVESPEGDIMRRNPPTPVPGLGPQFVSANRGKRSLVLDLKRERGREALLRLCERADIVVHNIRLQAMRRLRLDYPDIAAVNEKIVYVSLVGYDQTGPYANKPAYDDLIQGASGLAALFASVDGGEPRYVPLLVADRIVGISAVNAILAALMHRERSGEGQALEIPMFETMAEFVLGDHLGGHSYDPPAGDFGYQRLLTPHRRPYRTSDGYICVLLYTEAQWQRFFTLAGESAQFEADARLFDGNQRRAHYDFAYKVVGDILARNTCAYWLEALERSDIPVMPVHDLEHLVHDPHLTATGFIETVEDPVLGRTRALKMPARFSASPPGPPQRPPVLGEHGAEILREVGYDDAEIAEILSTRRQDPGT